MSTIMQEIKEIAYDDMERKCEALRTVEVGLESTIEAAYSAMNVDQAGDIDDQIGWMEDALKDIQSMRRAIRNEYLDLCEEIEIAVEIEEWRRAM